MANMKNKGVYLFFVWMFIVPTMVHGTKGGGAGEEEEFSEDSVLYYDAKSAGFSQIGAPPETLHWEDYMPTGRSALAPRLVSKRLEDYYKFQNAVTLSSTGFAGPDIDKLRIFLSATDFKYADYQSLQEGIEKPSQIVDGVSVICVTHRPIDLSNILDNFSRQTYKEKELILVLNGTKYETRKVLEAISTLKPDMRSHIHLLSDIPRDASLGKCLNIAGQKAEFNVITKFDGDDFYGPQYLDDVVGPLLWSRADISGKSCAPFYWEKTGGITFFTNRADPFLGQSLVSCGSVKPEARVFGSTVTTWTDTLKACPFQDITNGEDDQFFIDGLRKGLTIGGSDYTNHVVVRHDDPRKHTWDLTQMEGLRTEGFTPLHKSFSLAGILTQTTPM